MKKIDSNSGVTLVALIVLIIIMLILLAVVINFSTKPIQDSTDTQYKSELLIIQHALYEKLMENNQLKSENKDFPGSQIGIDNLPNEFLEVYEKANGEGTTPTGNYYLISFSIQDNEGNTTGKPFEELGLDGQRVTNSQFIVNYETGEVYNSTKKFYSDKITPVYLPGYGRYDVNEDTTSYMIEITTN